jgi:hypothetical protein
MARGYLRWSVKDLAEASGVAESTIKRMELQEGFPDSKGSNIKAVYEALVDAGVTFLPENGGGVGIRATKADARPAGRSATKRGPRDDDSFDAIGAFATA